MAEQSKLEEARNKRKKAIRKSISLIGWLATSERIKTTEDREIFNELSLKETTMAKAKKDSILRRHGISF